MKTILYYILGLWLSVNALHGQVVVQSGLTHRLSVPPGGSDTFPIKLKNIGPNTCGFSIELADLSTECDSGYRYLSPGSTAQSCAGWLESEKYSGSLTPQEEVLIKVIMRIPEHYNLPSAQACLLINSLPAESPHVFKRLNVNVRYALNVLYRNPVVPGVIALHAKTLQLDSVKGVWALRYLNTGNVDRIVSSKAHLLNENGQVIYRTESLHSKGFIPNQCRTLEFPSQELPSGKYQMVVISHTDLGERFGLTHSFER